MNMGLLAADLSLGSSSSCVKEMITSTAGTSGREVAVGEKQPLLYPLISSCDLHALQVYHKALEDERLKIQAFERELPFCMQLLENAIEASREQLEERLACKLNTPLHEPQLAAATQEFVCNYTSSVSHKSFLPAFGEINLCFKRKWTSTPSSSTHDRPRPCNHTASACATKWLLPQNTKLAQHEDSPITIKGSIKFQEFTSPELHALNVAAEEPAPKTSTHIVCNTKSIALNHMNATPSTHAMGLHNSKQALYSSVIHQQIQADKYMVTKMQDLPGYDTEGHAYASAMPVRSINDAANMNANHSPSTYPRPHSLTNLSRKELQISTAISEAGFHANNTALQSGGVQRKPRRCWSPELHQRFLSALNHLGGCQVATPKQIRELMNVEGLTNDEVKSHLQKFRLHMRRPNGALANSHGDSQQAGASGHHLVVFGHIWVPPEYGDEHHQHATNANMGIISTEFSSANGGMELMKSFRTSCGNKLNSMDHAGPVQHDSDLASARLMRLCQEEYCSDENQLMYESKGLHEIQLLDEGKDLTMERNAPSPPTDVESECCRQPQSAGYDHHRINSPTAMKERLLSRVDCINHDQFAAAEVSKKGEFHGKLHLQYAGARMNEKAEQTLAPQIVPECELVARKKMKVSSTSTDQQLLHSHSEDRNDNMDESEDH